MITSLRNIFFVVFLLASGLAQAQTKQYYVVIGAFAKESNSRKFSGYARSRFFQATYEMNNRWKLNYVYVTKTTIRKEAYDQVRILQKEKEFSDSWVYYGVLGNPAAVQIPVTQVNPEPPVTAPVKRDPPVQVMDVPEVKPDSVKALTSDSVSAVLTYMVNTKDSATSAPVVTTGGVNPLTLPPTKKAKGKYFKFNITTPDGQPLNGKVHHVDFKLGRDLAAYNSYEYNDILRPSNREEPMTLVCGIFGYQEVIQLVEYTDPKRTQDVVLDEHETWNIPFKLVRLRKGDVSVMYNVSFYKDAVIMLPRSKEELDELVNMMKSNPKYQIKIHGHTNGTSKRKIIGLGENRNYFEVKGSSEKTGSSKELSEDRASAIRDYLVEHGIEKNRMDLMAWGGSNMLVKETSPSARLNDRIEIEIIKD